MRWVHHSNNSLNTFLDYHNYETVSQRRLIYYFILSYNRTPYPSRNFELKVSCRIRRQKISYEIDQMVSTGLLTRAVCVWLVCMSLETVLGIARGAYLVPRIGQEHAKLVGFAISLVVLFVTARYFRHFLNIKRSVDDSKLLVGQLDQVGILWAFLSLLFEIWIGRLQGYSWELLADEFNPAKGSLMTIVGLPYMMLLPRLIGDENYPRQKQT